MPQTMPVSQTIESPIGPLLMVATEEGLVKVAFNSENVEKVEEDLSVFYGTSIHPSIGELAGAARQFEEYFAGIRKNFELPLDRSLSLGFRRDVHERISTIPYGETVSYKDVAVGIGNEGAVRAVGSACGANPLPVVVPCHRVLRSDGSLGGYAGGLELKKKLLDLEQSF